MADLDPSWAARAGPGVVGLGIDLVDVERFRRALQRRPALERRLFDAAEVADAGRYCNRWPHLAGRFALKEAALKALGIGMGTVSWREIVALRQPSGAPGLELRGRAEALASARGIGCLRCSLTHTHALAQATVIAVGSAVPGRQP